MPMHAWRQRIFCLDCNNMVRTRMVQKRRKAVRKQSWDWRRPVFHLIVMGFIGGVGYVFLVLPIAQITQINVTVSDDTRIASDEVQAVVRNTLSSTYLQHIPRAQFVTVRKARITSVVHDAFGAAQTVSVTKKFPNEINIDIVAWERIFLWCAGARVDDSECRILGSDGRVGRVVSSDEKLLTDNPITRIIDTSARRVTAGALIYDNTGMEFLRKLVPAIVQIGLEIPDENAIIITTPARVSGQLRLVTKNGWDVLVTTEQSLPAIMYTLQAVLDYEIPSERHSEIQYIDLRVNNKAIYKMREDNTVVKTDKLQELE